MSKHKNRDRNKHQARSTAERGAEESKNTSMEAQSEQMQTQASPSNMAHKGRERRFGHN
ncbi:hypothetical protein AB0I49_24465 [Streptomyces sp. NPDC050617]|uniref:hypothetical protein n=1 Tax=Streptomyces sp. NPDC050617 TaxID=3154628 RepID=UPI00343B0505